MVPEDCLHEVVLEFEDGVTRTILVPGDETVLSAALDSGIQLLHQCRSGSCGTCSARVIEGETVMSKDRALALLPSEVAVGHRLTCSTHVQSAARLRLPYPSEFAFGAVPQRWEGIVTAARWLAARVVRLEVRLTDPGHLSFAAGQYMRLEVPGTGEWRSYSMATTQKELPELAFLVKVLPSGAMSDYLQRATAGHQLWLEGPYGSFRRRSSARPHVMIAGGTGLAPMLAMLDELRVAPGRTPRVTLCFACSREDGLFHLDELDLRRMWMPTLEVRIGVSRPRSPTYNGQIANPVGLTEDRDFAGGDADVYACGPAGMVEAARRRAAAAGVPEDRISSEQFLPSRHD